MTTTPDVMQHTTQFLTNNIQILPCPSMSPDLNPIKLIRDKLDRRVRGGVNASANVRELFQELQQEWVAILGQVIHHLIQSVPTRC